MRMITASDSEFRCCQDRRAGCKTLVRSLELPCINPVSGYSLRLAQQFPIIPATARRIQVGEVTRELDSRNHLFLDWKNVDKEPFVNSYDPNCTKPVPGRTGQRRTRARTHAHTHAHTHARAHRITHSMDTKSCVTGSEKTTVALTSITLLTGTKYQVCHPPPAQPYIQHYPRNAQTNRTDD